MNDSWVEKPGIDGLSLLIIVEIKGSESVKNHAILTQEALDDILARPGSRFLGADLLGGPGSGEQTDTAFLPHDAQSH